MVGRDWAGKGDVTLLVELEASFPVVVFLKERTTYAYPLQANNNWPRATLVAAATQHSS